MTDQLVMSFGELPANAKPAAKRASFGAIRPSRACNTEVLPSHWAERPLSCLARINAQKLADDTDPDYELDYIDIGNVDMVEGVQSTERYRFEDAPSRARRRVKDGDTIISTVRTYLKAVARIVNPPQNLIASTGFAVLSPKSGCDPGYLYRLVQNEPFVQKVVAHSVGVSYPAINAPEIGKFLVPVPPLAEQQRIAVFLDRETARIDRLIGEKTRLIDLLAEKRAAVITHAVTRGLNPNAKVKPSGIEWLGDIPAHWTVCALRRKWRVLDCKHRTVPFVDEGIPIASIGEVQSLKIDLTNAKKTTEEEYFELIAGDRRPRQGDIIYSRNATVGAAAFVDTNARFCMGQDVCLIRSATQNQHFLTYQLRSPVVMEQLESVMVGATFKRVNVADIKSLIVLCPPVQEQNQIASYCELRDRELSTLRATVVLAIARLREYRSALITAAVTGRIDVRQPLHSEGASR